MRIAQNGFVEVVQKVNILIPAWRFKAKLRSAKMLMSARPTKNKIERIVTFEFEYETRTDFKYFGVIRCPEIKVSNNFHFIFI